PGRGALDQRLAGNHPGGRDSRAGGIRPVTDRAHRRWPGEGARLRHVRRCRRATLPRGGPARGDGGGAGAADPGPDPRARRGVDGAGRDARRRSGEARRHRPPVPRRDQLRHVHRLRSARRRVPRGGGTAGHDRSGGLAVTAATRAATMAAGARRWDLLPGTGFQPAELATLAMVLYLAHWLDRRGKAARSFWTGLVPFALLAAPGFVLIAAEPDLGTAGVYAAAALAVFFMAGANLLYLGAIGSAVMAGTAAMIAMTPYQLQRVPSFLDPFRDPPHTGYNAVQSLMALALGGITGLGLGASRQKFLYLPAPSTDFIFAIIGEEWGLVGT